MSLLVKALPLLDSLYAKLDSDDQFGTDLLVAKLLPIDEPKKALYLDRACKVIEDNLETIAFHKIFKEFAIPFDIGFSWCMRSPDKYTCVRGFAILATQYPDKAPRCKAEARELIVKEGKNLYISYRQKQQMAPLFGYDLFAEDIQQNRIDALLDEGRFKDALDAFGAPPTEDMQAIRLIEDEFRSKADSVNTQFRQNPRLLERLTKQIKPHLERIEFILSKTPSGHEEVKKRFLQVALQAAREGKRELIERYLSFLETQFQKEQARCARKVISIVKARSLEEAVAVAKERRCWSMTCTVLILQVADGEPSLLKAAGEYLKIAHDSFIKAKALLNLAEVSSSDMQREAISLAKRCSYTLCNREKAIFTALYARCLCRIGKSKAAAQVVARVDMHLMTAKFELTGLDFAEKEALKKAIVKIACIVHPHFPEKALALLKEQVQDPRDSHGLRHIIAKLQKMESIKAAFGVHIENTYVEKQDALSDSDFRTTGDILFDMLPKTAKRFFKIASQKNYRFSDQVHIALLSQNKQQERLFGLFQVLSERSGKITFDLERLLYALTLTKPLR